MVAKEIRILFIICVAILFASCKKELDIDYSTITPQYVVEAYVTNEGCNATVTMTQDVEATDSATTVDDAIITVSGSDGTSFSLSPKGKGEYSSPVQGKTGVTYTMTAKMGDVITTASSTMLDSVTVDSCTFYRQDIMDKPCYTYELMVQDNGEEMHDYYICLYRNGKSYKWTGHQNKQSYQGRLIIDMICFTENDNAEDSKKLKDWLYDGDLVTGFITRIDEDSYTYYTSWKTAGRTYSNPITNLSNGVLGIFSAQRVTHFKPITFDKATMIVK